MHTPSVTKPGKMMYRGRKSNDSVSIPDARQLLKNRGISTVLTEYRVDDGGKALGDLSIAVADPEKAAMVGVRGATIWEADVDREVVVTDLDATTNTVCLNGICDEQFEVSLDHFVTAWQASGFELIVAEVTEQPEPRPATWMRIRPRRESVDPAMSGHLLHFRNRR